MKSSRSVLELRGRGRKVGMTPGQHVPLISWATHMIQWSLQRVAMVKAGANPYKGGPSSD